MGVSIDLKSCNIKDTIMESKNISDREDGEIIDDEFEDISSDEEINVRKRIEELEAKNLELEKIDNISGIYNCGKTIRYTTRHTRDDLPSRTFLDIDNKSQLFQYVNEENILRNKKSDYLTNYKTDNIKLSNEHYKNSSKKVTQRKRKHGLSNKNHKKRKSSKLKKMKLKHDNLSSDNEYYIPDGDLLKKINNIKFQSIDLPSDKKNSNQEKLHELKFKLSNDCNIEEISDDDSDNSITLEEQELRLIALKSAVMKKHYNRKKKKEIDDKKPYSPSEFLQLNDLPIEIDISDGSVSVLSDNENIKSPPPSNLINNDCILNPIDMDLGTDSNNSSDYPLFIGNNNNNTKILKENPILSYENYDKTDSSNLIIDTDKTNSRNFQKININDENECVEIKTKNCSPEPIDEEEVALRALLLAKLNCTKIEKNAIIKTEKQENIPLINEKINKNENDNNSCTLDPQVLTNLLFLGVDKNSTKKTEVVLKEAVKRLRNNTNNSNVFDKLTFDSSNLDEKLNKNIKNVPENNIIKKNQIKEFTTNSTFNSLIYPKIEDNLTNLQKNEIIFNTNITKTDDHIIKMDYELDINSKKNVLKENTNLENNETNKCNEIIREPLVSIQSITNNSHIKQNDNLNIINKCTNNTLLLNKNNLVLHEQKTNLKKINHIQNGKIMKTITQKQNKLSSAIKTMYKTILPQNKKQFHFQSQINNQNSNKIISKNNINDKLIKKLDIPKVNKLIIHLGKSDSDTDSDLSEINDNNTNNFKDIDYYNNSSPLSLPMRSPCYSPIPNITKDDNNKEINIITNDNQELTTNENFQIKLDEFLKNARTKVDMIKKDETSVIKEDNDKIPENSLAVCHLPPSSQLEYRRLVNRMKILMKQKQTKEQNVNNNNTKEIITNPNINKIENSSSIQINSLPNENKQLVLETTPSEIETTPSETIINDESYEIEKEENIKKEKLLLLKRYETAYEKNSHYLIGHIEKTINLVNSAKEEKYKKFTIENKLNRLKKEMEILENKLKGHNDKITKLYPAIKESQKNIIRLKVKSSKIDKIANQMGKCLNGDQYRLNNDKKDIIDSKSKELALNIIKLKNFKSNDISEDNNYKNAAIQTNLEINNDIGIDTNENSKLLENISAKNQNYEAIKVKKDDNINLLIKNISIITNKGTITSDNESKMISENIQEIYENEKKILYNTINEIISSDNNCKLSKDGIFIDKYISPIAYNSEIRILNPNGIICPNQLSNKCDDKDCKFEHL